MIDVSELIRGPEGRGTPWSGLHCGQLAHRVLTDAPPHGMGWDVPEEALLLDGDLGQSQELLEGYLERQAKRWEKVGTFAADANQLGDVIVSKAPAGSPSPIHFSIIVDDVGRRIVTTSEKTGVISTAAWAVQDVIGVYRWRREP